jgi:hypothetical protein
MLIPAKIPIDTSRGSKLSHYQSLSCGKKGLYLTMLGIYLSLSPVLSNFLSEVRNIDDWKVNVTFSVCTPSTRLGGVKVWLHTFITSTLGEGMVYYMR